VLDLQRLDVREHIVAQDDAAEDRGLGVEVVRQHPTVARHRANLHEESDAPDHLSLPTTQKRSVATTPAASRTGDSYLPSALIGWSSWIQRWSMSTPAFLSCSAMSRFVTEPNSFSSSPTMRSNCSVMPLMRVAISVAVARSFSTFRSMTARS